MPDKLLSLITINYQNVAGLRATMESVFSQEQNKHWEWILIDGGSKDGSAELVLENQHAFSYFCIEPDEGIYDAMNKGLAQAKGNFVWFLNSGDRLHGKDAMQKFLDALVQYPKADCFYSDTLFVNENYEILGPISKLKPQTFPKHLTYESFRYGMNICHQSFIVRKSIAPKYDKTYRLSADINWILDILKKRPVCIELPGYLSEFQTGGSSTQNNRRAVKERYLILKNHFGFLPNLWAHFWIGLRRFLFKNKLKTSTF